jgi:hypothetical protein
VIFSTYAFSVGRLTPSVAFVVLSLFNTLRFPLVVLPKALRGVSGRPAGGRLTVIAVPIILPGRSVIAELALKGMPT